MKKYFLLSMMMLMMMTMSFTSCGDDDKVITTPVSLSIDMPLGLENVVLSNAKATFTNVASNETYSVEQFVNNNGSFTASVMIAAPHLLHLRRSPSGTSGLEARAALWLCILETILVFLNMLSNFIIVSSPPSAQ